MRALVVVLAACQALSGASLSSTRVNRPRDGAISQQLPRSAIDAMNAYYNPADGRWSSSAAWWLTGNALQAVLDYIYVTGDRSELDRARRTIDAQRGPLPWWPQGGGEFRAQSTDDTGWWALAMVRMFDITGETQFLDIARADEAYMRGYWDSGYCGGGIIWEISPASGPQYKNAISNELYIKLAASLASRVPSAEDRGVYAVHAVAAWEWFRQRGIINPDALVNDGIDASSCANNGQTTWTYNQGVIIGALAELNRATGQADYLVQARRVADAVTSGKGGLTTAGGILREPCEAASAGGAGSCNGDQAAFKGIFARNLAELDVLLEGRPYKDFLVRNAQTASASGRDPGNNYGIGWAGPFDGALSIGSQSSAVGLLVAALR